MVRLVFYGFLLACAATGGTAGYFIARPSPARLEVSVPSTGVAEAVTVIAGDIRIPLGSLGGALRSYGETNVRAVELPRTRDEVRVEYLDHGQSRTMKVGRVDPASLKRVELALTPSAPNAAEPPRRAPGGLMPSPFGSPLLRP